MSSYYYLVASLPTLNFQSASFLSYQDFLKNCQSQLSEKDFHAVAQATLQHDEVIGGADETLNSWARFNRAFGNEMARFRAVRFGYDPADYMRGEKSVNPYLAETVAQAAKNTDLLAAEKFLDGARWKFLDDLLIGRFFDVAVLIVYGLKLQILDRYQTMELPKGKEVFNHYKNYRIPEEHEAMEHV